MTQWIAGVVLACLSLSAVTFASTYSLHRELKRMNGYTILGYCTISEITPPGHRERFVTCDGGSVFLLESPALVLALPLSDVIVFGRVGRGGTIDSHKLLFESDDILNAARIR